MAIAFVMRQALNACQMTKKIVIEAADALISVRYYSFNSSGSSCSVSNAVPIVNVYWSAWLSSRLAHSMSLWTSSLAIVEC